MNSRLKSLFLVAADVLLINLCVFIVLVLRLEPPNMAPLEEFLPHIIINIPILTFFYLLLTFWLRTYSVMWVFASAHDLVKVNAVCALSTVCALITAAALEKRLPATVYVVSAVFMMVCVTGVRLLDRSLTSRRMNAQKHSSIPGERFLVIGAGDAASILIRNMNRLDIASKNIFVVDDDRAKLGQQIHGCRIVGSSADIARVAGENHVDSIIFAIPSMNDGDRAVILNSCSQTGCAVFMMPGLDKILTDPAKATDLRPISIDDLLGRDPIVIKGDEVTGYLTGKRVLVTGGGGSIGSELCRQIAQCAPEKLIVFDFYENTTYDLEHELRSKHPDLDLTVLIGSVRDHKRLEAVFSKYRPQIVFHAAAHKHVPLMEDSPNEAIKNNVFGTFKTATVADKYGAERFILISTDKAVNPTNIMGASKRLCEMIIQSFSARSKTVFAAVRFGNVLGSNGSVIPLFKKQIEKGGPVTVTHPDIIRYFMTIPEAVSLVLNAGAYAGGGEIFVLDMGKPMKILDLAENLIRLSGFTPYKDIDIVFTGLRPGEKLFEELLMSEEGLDSTANKLIFVGHPMDFDADRLNDELDRLYESMYDEDIDIRETVRRLVPTYDPERKCNENAPNVSADKEKEALPV